MVLPAVAAVAGRAAAAGAVRGGAAAGARGAAGASRGAARQGAMEERSADRTRREARERASQQANQQSQQQQQEEEKPHIGPIVSGLLVGTAALFDGIQAFVGFFHIIPVVGNGIATIVGWYLFALGALIIFGAFKLLGVKFLNAERDAFKKVLSLFGMAGLETVSTGLFPSLTPWTISVILSENGGVAGLGGMLGGAANDNQRVQGRASGIVGGLLLPARMVGINTEQTPGYRVFHRAAERADELEQGKVGWFESVGAGLTPWDTRSVSEKKRDKLREDTARMEQERWEGETQAYLGAANNNEYADGRAFDITTRDPYARDIGSTPAPAKSNTQPRPGTPKRR